MRLVSAACLNAVPRADDWRAALATLAQEMRRLERYGVTQAEFDAYGRQLRASLDLNVATSPNRGAATTAAGILANLISGDTFDTPAEDRRVKLAGFAQLTRDAVNDALKRRWTAAGRPLIVLLAPTHTPEAELKTAWESAQAAPPPAAPTPTATKPWAYTSFGPPGKAVERQQMSDPDFVRVRFENGVQLNFKRTRTPPGVFFARVRFSHGQQQLRPSDLPAAAIGSGLLVAGGLGRNSADDLQRICEGRVCGASLSLGREHASLSGGARSEDLELELEYLTAFLTDAAFRPTLNARLPTFVSAFYRTSVGTPFAAASRALSDALPRPHVFDLPSEAELARYRAGDFARVLRPLLRDTPLEVTVAGDLEEGKAVAAVAATLGALPPRRGSDEPLPDAPRLRYPASAPPVIRVSHQGSAEAAAVMVKWPLFVWSPQRLRDLRAVELLARVMQDELVSDVRQRLGQTYSPQVGVSLDTSGDQGALTVAVQTTPKDADAVEAEVRKIAARLAAGGVTAEALERARTPVLSHAADRERSDAYWLETLDGSWRDPGKLGAARSWARDYAGLTLTEVQAAAARWLAPAPMAAIALPSADLKP